jgi:hypothetical protein
VLKYYKFTSAILAWTFEAVFQEGISSSDRMWCSHSSIMKNFVFWDFKPCSSVKVDWCFSPFECQRISQGRGLPALCHHTNFLLGLFFDPEGEGDMFLWNVPHKIELFMSNLMTGLPCTVHWYAGD